MYYVDINKKLTNNTQPNKRNGIIIGIILCFLVLIGIVSSYAFFQIVGTGNTNEEISTETGNLSLVLSDGNPGLATALEFGSSAEKTFSITNDGSLDAVAKINWKNITNSYLEGSLTYSLSYSEIETGIYIDVITNENVPRSETPQTLELANGLTIPSGKTYYYKLTITLNYTDFDQTADLKASLSTEFSIEEGNRNLVRALLAKTNDISITEYEVGNKGEMFTFTHPEAEQTKGWSENERTDYRYIGNVPNNYIEFNDETWRIIGVFTVEGKNNLKEQRVKIIREASIGNLAWDAKNINEWPSSSLFKLLNSGDYYNSTGTYSTSGLTDKAKKQLTFTKWYLGGSSDLKSFEGTDYYNFERGVTTCVTTGKCSGETRSLNEITNVGLMYPSDYIYTYSNGVNNTCYTNPNNCDRGNPRKGWMFNSMDEWTISPASSYSAKAFDLRSTGFVSFNDLGLSLSENTRPCVYLRSDIEIIDGDGSQEHPYILKEV